MQGNNGDEGVHNVDPPQAAAVALKIPNFWRNNVSLYFKQVESAFELSRITSDDTKYNALVATIDSDILAHISDVILNTPTNDKYNTLKNRLIAEFADSDSQRIKKLLSDLPLGDKKPSLLLREMRELSSGQLTDDILRNLWMQRLPKQVQSILSASSERLQELAMLADKIHEVTSDSSVFSLATNSGQNSVTDQIKALTAQVQNLTEKVEKLSFNRSRNFSKNRFQKRNLSRSPSRPRDNSYDSTSGMCFYHARFQDKAKKCNAPCNYTPQGNLQ